MQTELRTLQQADLEMVRHWRNHASVKYYMFHQHEILEKEHLAWFTSSMRNPLRFLFVYCENNTPVGFVQLQKKHENMGVFEWGFYISPQAPKGTGSRMVLKTLSHAFEQLDATKVYAEVLGFNAVSIHLHKKFKFTEEGVLREQFYLHGAYQNVHCFGLLKTEWL